MFTNRSTLLRILFRPYYVCILFFGTLLFCEYFRLTQMHKDNIPVIPPSPPPPPPPPIQNSTELILVGDALGEVLRRRPRHEVSREAPKPFLCDYAAEYLSGSITDSSNTYENKSNIVHFASIPIFYETPKSPSVMLHRSVRPLKKDDYWQMDGREGHFSVALYEPTIIHAFGYRHANVSDVASAPAHFSFSVRSEREKPGKSIKRWVYNVSFGGLQRCYLDEPITAQFIDVKVLSNHGNSDYTAMYRFYVFGEKKTHLLELY